MKRFFKLLGVLTSVTLFSTFITGCADSDYDIGEDIDLTMSLGNNVSFPLGSSEKITMDEMITLHEGEDETMKSDEQGNYYLYKSDKIDETNFSVDPFEIEYEGSNGVMNAYSFDYEKQEGVPDDMKFPYRIHTTIEDAVGLRTNDKDTVKAPKEMLELYTLDELEGEKLILDISIEISGNAETLDTIFLGDDDNPFFAKFPDYLVFDPSCGIGDDNKLYYTGEMMIKTGKKDGRYVYEFPERKSLIINKLVFPKGQFDWTEEGNTKEHVIRINNDIDVVGLVYCDSLYISANDINDLKCYVIEDIAPFAMTVNKVTGRFDPEIDAINQKIEFDLDEDLDFLKEDDVVLDITNPTIKLDIVNPVDVPITASVQLKGIRNSSVIEGSNVYFEIELPNKGTNQIYVTRTGEALSGYTSVAVTELGNLLTKIPDDIQIDIQPSVKWNGSADPHVLTFGDMIIDGDYIVDVPLSFNSVHLVYTETMDDVLGDDPEEVTDYITDIDEITLSLTVQNTSPLGMSITAKAKDANGNVLPNITAVTDKPIKAGTGYKNAAVDTDIVITLSCTNNELKDLCDLDILLTTDGGGQLNEKDYIILKNMVLSINKPIEANFNN